MIVKSILYNSCEYVVAQPVQPNGFHHNGEWLIQDDNNIIAALESLRNPEVCPAALIFAPTMNIRQNNSFDDLVFIAKRKRCSLQIVSPRFHQPAKPSDAMDLLCKKLFVDFASNDIRSTVTKYGGSLCSDDIVNFISPSSVTSLGLVVASPKDLEMLSAVIHQMNWKLKNVTDIHLSIARTLQPEDFQLFQKFCPCQLSLKFFSMSNQDVNWMVNMTLALDKPFTKSHVGVDEINLPDSELSLKGLEEMLKTFKLRDKRLAYPVVVETSAVHEGVKDTLSEETSEAGGPRLYFKGRTRFSLRRPSNGKMMAKVHAFKEKPKETSALRKDELIVGLTMIFMIQFWLFWFKFN